LEENPQADLFAAMARPDFYPHPVKAVEKRETHISCVFLTGSRVYKVKKAVDLGFLDFTSLERRRHFCGQELGLNRRLSEGVYLDVVAIRRLGSRFSLGEAGEVVEYAVCMRQLSDAATLGQRLRAGTLGRGVCERLAERLAVFYREAPTGGGIDRFGSREMVGANCEENFTQILPFVPEVLDPRQFQIVRSATRAFLSRRLALFQRRLQTGRIRDGHGDLRTDHVYLVDGEIQVLDCIEFNDRFRYGDPAADLAFLAMDLDAQGFPSWSRDLMAAFVRASGDADIFILLDFYKCYRACVRCKVACLRLGQGGLSAAARRAVAAEAGHYLTLAYRYAVQFTRPTLWVVCGMPATGKSTVARTLGRRMGVAVLRSDVVRKTLFDRRPQTPAVAGFGQGIYTPGAGALTYGRLLLDAQEHLEKGHSVILDATFSDPRQRAEALRLALDSDANILFVECFAADRVLRRRLAARGGRPSVSDARLEHFAELKARYAPLDEIPAELLIRLDTDQPLEACLDRLLVQDHRLLTRETAAVLAR
jgi:aminoglycoside phosphotransferase family enzyme/predicted kinase